MTRTTTRTTRLRLSFVLPALALAPTGLAVVPASPDRSALADTAWIVVTPDTAAPGGAAALWGRLPIQALFIAWAIAAGRRPD